MISAKIDAFRLSFLGSTEMALEALNINGGYGKAQVLFDVSLAVPGSRFQDLG